MSATSSLPPGLTESPSSTATNTAAPSNPGSAPSSTLYLLTFLATLFVLLTVSCAIVLRSFLIRRRFRLQIQQQIALGLLPPEALGPKRNFGEKPKLWDVHLGSHDENDMEEYEGWEDVIPVAARIAHDPTLPSAETKDTPPTTDPPHAEESSHFMFRRHHRRPSVHSDAPSIANATSEDLTEGQDVQVAVMVTMPSQRHRNKDDLPEVLIGLSTVPIKGGS
ncbi:hypothetical protein BDW22DRAFT_1353386 [Trametopsis cervina]|nr:hypothetical protein BDW22DRAFT_1353386 [Trametopsis cervina]